MVRSDKEAVAERLVAAEKALVECRAAQRIAQAAAEGELQRAQGALEAARIEQRDFKAAAESVRAQLSKQLAAVQENQSSVANEHRQLTAEADAEKQLLTRDAVSAKRAMDDLVANQESSRAQAAAHVQDLQVAHRKVCEEKDQRIRDLVDEQKQVTAILHRAQALQESSSARVEAEKQDLHLRISQLEASNAGSELANQTLANDMRKKNDGLTDSITFMKEDNAAAANKRAAEKEELMQLNKRLLSHIAELESTLTENQRKAEQAARDAEQQVHEVQHKFAQLEAQCKAAEHRFASETEQLISRFAKLEEARLAMADDREQVIADLKQGRDSAVAEAQSAGRTQTEAARAFVAERSRLQLQLSMLAGSIETESVRAHGDLNIADSNVRALERCIAKLKEEKVESEARSMQEKAEALKALSVAKRAQESAEESLRIGRQEAEEQIVQLIAKHGAVVSQHASSAGQITKENEASAEELAAHQSELQELSEAHVQCQRELAQLRRDRALQARQVSELSSALKTARSDGRSIMEQVKLIQSENETSCETIEQLRGELQRAEDNRQQETTKFHEEREALLSETVQALESCKQAKEDAVQETEAQGTLADGTVARLRQLALKLCLRLAAHASKASLHSSLYHWRLEAERQQAEAALTGLSKASESAVLAATRDTLHKSREELGRMGALRMLGSRSTMMRREYLLRGFLQMRLCAHFRRMQRMRHLVMDATQGMATELSTIRSRAATAATRRVQRHT
jgi:hypothetical protein